MKPITLVSVLLFVACAHAPQAGEIDALVRATMKERGIPGAAIAVVRGEKVVFSGVYGMAELETKRPVKHDTIFQIASTTKPFTAMAVLMLAEDGKLSLSDRAARHLSWLPEIYHQVTIEQLLAHTSGVARDLRRENVDEFPMSEFRTRLEAAPQSFAPGTKWEYSNTGYTLLSLIVESVSGVELGAFLERRIFAPLDMRDTSYRVLATGDVRHAVGYDYVDGKPVRAPHVFSGWGNSGIESTALDLAKFAIAIERGKLLRPESYRVMFAPHTDVFTFRGAPTTYGYGWFLTKEGDRPLITHGGAIAGFSSILNRYSEERTAIIVLSNAKQWTDRGGQADAIAKAITPAVRNDH